jgi:maltooligosyltrehalose trehalohydrolase
MHSVITNHTRIDGAVLTDTAMVLRYFGQEEHLLLILNLGADLDLTPAPEPLLAPPGPDQWSVIWSSESIAYGGQGTPSLWPEPRWRILGEAAVLLGGRPGEPHAHD